MSTSERPIQKKSLSADTDNRSILPIISADISAEIEARLGEKSAKIVHKLGMLFYIFSLRLQILKKQSFCTNIAAKLTFYTCFST